MKSVLAVLMMLAVVAPLRAATADFNRDGHSDIMIVHVSGRAAAWLMNGTTVSSIVDFPSAPPLRRESQTEEFGIRGTADFNDDGHTDFVLRDNVGGRNVLYLMNGTTATSVVDLPGLTGGFQFRIQGTADLNDDGSTDILVRNSHAGTNAVWLMNGTSFVSVVDLPATSGPLGPVGGGDFNGDGQDDILLRNADSGANAIWLMNGTDVASIVDLPGLPVQSCDCPDNFLYGFSFPGVADFDGDGDPDILVARTDNKGGSDRYFAVAIWLMNGTTLSSVVDLPGLHFGHEIVGPR